MKHFICILLLAGILLPGFTRLAILIDYQVHKEYISKNLCVNRREPKSCCEGKCQLNKNLSEAEKKEDPSPLTRLKNSSELFPCTISGLLSLHIGLELISTISSVYPDRISSVPALAIFHPPDTFLI